MSEEFCITGLTLKTVDFLENPHTLFFSIHILKTFWARAPPGHNPSLGSLQKNYVYIVKYGMHITMGCNSVGKKNWVLKNSVYFFWLYLFLGRDCFLEDFDLIAHFAFFIKFIVNYFKCWCFLA